MRMQNCRNAIIENKYTYVGINTVNGKSIDTYVNIL